jgi:hypothetical protein
MTGLVILLREFQPPRDQLAIAARGPDPLGRLLAITKDSKVMHRSAD